MAKVIMSPQAQKVCSCTTTFVRGYKIPGHERNRLAECSTCHTCWFNDPQHGWRPISAGPALNMLKNQQGVIAFEGSLRGA